MIPRLRNKSGAQGDSIKSEQALGARVWITLGLTDSKQGTQCLALLVQKGLKYNPHGGDLMVFRDRACSLIKIIWHDGISISLCLASEHGSNLNGNLQDRLDHPEQPSETQYRASHLKRRGGHTVLRHYAAVSGPTLPVLPPSSQRLSYGRGSSICRLDLRRDHWLGAVAGLLLRCSWIRRISRSKKAIFRGIARLIRGSVTE
jgi:hypothetical protein